MITMKISINQLRNEFKRLGRINHFSPEGFREFYEWLEMIGSECAIELDVIQICGEYSEDTIENTLEYYGLESIHELEDKTIVIPVGKDRVIIENF